MSEELVKIVAGLGALFTLLGVIYRGIKNSFINIRKIWKKIEDALSQLDYVYKEIKPNHGSSLYDKISSIEKRLDFSSKNDAIHLYITRQAREDISSLYAFHGVDLSYCEFNEVGNMVYASKTLEDLTGLKGYEMLGNGWLSFIHEDQRESVYGGWISSIQKKIPFEMSARIISKTKDILNSTLRMEPIKNDNGDIVYYIGKVIRR